MRVIIYHLYNDSQEVVEGTKAHVYQKLIDIFPWLESGDADHHNDVPALVEQIDAMQACSAEIIPENSLVKSDGNLFGDDLEDASEVALDMLGFNPIVHPAFAAAKFLSGKPELSLAQVRQALYNQEDYVDAACEAYQLPLTDDSRKAVRAVMNIGDFSKAQGDSALPAGKDIEPGSTDGKDTAEALLRAFKLGQVKVAHLDGKHSKGSLIARDNVQDKTYLLKPGSGGQSPAAGASQETASQSRRETAFWHVAEDWGLGDSVPRCDLVLIDGKEYAAIQMLPFSWKGLQKKLNVDANAGKAAFQLYRDRGLLHKWAVLDYVLGNPDRHGDNMMISEDDRLLGLIDHGSAFAGPGFDPAYDKNSFVPFYLRGWAGPKFNRLTVREKLDRMPTVGKGLREELRAWLNGIHADQLEGLLSRFGIDPRPSLARLAKVKLAADTRPVDEAINRLWVTT
jgi:hypothetical protein